MKTASKVAIKSDGIGIARKARNECVFDNVCGQTEKPFSSGEPLRYRPLDTLSFPATDRSQPDGPRPRRSTQTMMPILKKVIESLRDELQQYGEMLALLDQQQDIFTQRGTENIWHSISAINHQGITIHAARECRHSFRRQLARTLKQPEDCTFGKLLPLLPDHYRPLVSALVQENNELLQRVSQRAEQNHLLLRRSLDLMQNFLTTLAQPGQAMPLLKGWANPTGPSDPSLYEAIV